MKWEIYGCLISRDKRDFLHFVRAFGDRTTSLRLFRGIKGENNPVITVGRDGRFRLLNRH